MQTSNDRAPLMGKAAEEHQARLQVTSPARQGKAKAQVTVDDAVKAGLVPPVRMAGGGRVSDLIARLIARQDKRKADRELSPVRRSIRDQVRSITESFLGGTPTPERNRQAYVEAMATKRNHLGQLSHVYPGTVSAKTIAHRRARTKMAKASRKANRHG